MNQEVSCRALQFLFRAADKRGVPLARLLEGVEFPLSHLRNKHERIDWPTFVRINANASRIWSESELLEMAPNFLQSPFVRALFLPARILFGPRELFRWALSERGGGDQLFTCVKNSYSSPSPDMAVLELTLPDGYPSCPEFFLISKAVFTALPGLVGLGPANVKMTTLARGARYEIRYPVEDRVFPRIRRAITWPFTAAAAARELKDAHEALRQRYAELEDYKLNLEKKVEERTNELAQTVAKLKDAQEARDKLFANINHEIRTPLSLISLAIADVRRRRTDLDEKTYQQLDGVEASTRQLLRLVDGLLVLAAGQEDRLKLRIAPFDVAGRARSTVSIWSNAAASRGLSMSYHGPDSLVMHADEGAIDRILANLISNALKFTPSGGSIAVEVHENDGKIELAVRDTGVGIDDEFRKRIFGRFEQGRAAVHAGSQGSGVGLSIVRELSRAHGGDVEVESPSKGGSRFVVTLPSMPAPAVLSPVSRASEIAVPSQAPVDFGITEAGAQATAVLEPTGVAHATVLVAEDNPRLRAQVAELLQTEYRVLVAPDGISALNLARKHLPDMLVSDIGMPGMDGLELTRRFRELNGNRLAPVLLLTAMGSVRKRLEGFEAGAVDYITKPFEPDELRARIRNQLLLRSLALRLHETEKTIALGVLSTGLAHELRNPANGIANAIPPLRKLLGDALREELPAGQLFKVVEQCTEQLGTLSRQLLGLRSGSELELVDIPAEDLVSRAVSLASAALEGRNVHRVLEFKGTLPCAPSTILQVLGNLLENAAHAAGPGGSVRLSTGLVGDRVVFEIADSGPGVPVELRQKIFEPFFTTKPPGAGTGLGLATAREIVLKHSGSIEVRDGNPGAVFRVELPAGTLESRSRQRAG